jgi:hypothetical protein
MAPTDMAKSYTNNNYSIVSTPVMGVTIVCNVALLYHICLFYLRRKKERHKTLLRHKSAKVKRPPLIITTQEKNTDVMNGCIGYQIFLQKRSLFNMVQFRSAQWPVGCSVHRVSTPPSHQPSSQVMLPQIN